MKINKIKIFLKKHKNKIAFYTVIFLVLLGTRTTYSYWLNNINNESKSYGNVIMGTVDSLTFETNDISLTATQSNFFNANNNLSTSGKGSAILLANNETNHAERTYQVYFKIIENNFEYTTASEESELILSVTDPSGKQITSIEGLNYVTNKGVSGFDVTTGSGTYVIAENQDIISNSSVSSTVHKWIFTLTLINLDGDQTANAGKKFTTEIVMQEQQLTHYNYTLLAENSDITGKDATLKNILGSAGDFEDTVLWNNCVYNTSYNRYAGGSCSIVGDASAFETLTTSTNSYALNSSHTYYKRSEVSVSASTDTSKVSTDTYWPIAEPSFLSGYKLANNSWTIVSNINTRSSFNSGNYPIRYDFNNANTSGTMYIDGAMLIDLTASYGSSYPSKEFLDENLIYFANEADIKTINTVREIVTFEINNVYKYNQVECTNGATGTINGNIITINRADADTTCHLSYKNGSKLSEVVSLGDYVTYNPTPQTYTTNSSLTGYSDGTTFSSSGINKWRVMGINSDGTVELISAYALGSSGATRIYASGARLHLSGRTGYNNYIKIMRDLSQIYGNSEYTISTRMIGDNSSATAVVSISSYTQCGTTSTSNNNNESRACGDTYYLDDYNTLTKIDIAGRTGNGLTSNLGMFKGDNTESPFWIASRYYEYSNNVYLYKARIYNSRSSITSIDVFTYDPNLVYHGVEVGCSGYTSCNWHSNYNVRPIVMLKANLTISAGNGSESEPFVLS